MPMSASQVNALAGLVNNQGLSIPAEVTETIQRYRELFLVRNFKDIVENKNDKDNEMFWCIMKDIHEELRGKHFDEVYATYQVDNMYHTDNKGNKITSPMFTPIDVRKLYDKKFKSINSNITFWDVYVALNAQYHDNIELYKEWFGEDNIENIKDKIIESAIVNWFEDEDAGIEKVWNYFRAI